jgi:alcohol dehydrogenase (cytochrome c)
VLGNTLYLSTLDSRLVALDAVSGSVRWETEVADWADGYSMTAAPLVVGNSVVVGVSGGEYAIRGFLAAYDATTGNLQWRFDTVPGPGETGHESWENDAWKSGGGATWATGSYDPELDLIYWGVGNPSPVYQAAVRPGDNLFTASVIALHAKTGKLAWYFQFSPHDEHDWDAAQTPVLVDLDVGGGKRKVLCWPNRNGFYYVLDRATGQFITATPFARQNWALGIDAKGRPIPDPARKVTESGVLTFPSAGGASNWQPAAYDPVRKLVYVRANDQGAVFTNTAPGNVTRGATNIYVASSAASTGNPLERVRALEAATGKLRWERAQDDMRSSGGYAGLLATGGGVVFGANRGYVFALDSDTGNEVWRLALGEYTASPPISFEIDGKQVVGLWSGRSYFMFGL